MNRTARCAKLLCCIRAGLLCCLASVLYPQAPPQSGPDWPAPDSLVPISLETAKSIRQIGQRGAAQIEEMVWSPDDRLLGLRSSSGLAVYRLATEKGPRLEKLRVIAGDRVPISFAFRKGEDVVATANGSKTVTVWDLRSGWAKYEVKDAGAQVTAIAACPVSPVLAATAGDGKLRIWREEALESPPQVLDDHKEGAAGLCVDGKGKWIVTWARWNKVNVWSLADGSLAHALDLGTDNSFMSVGPAFLAPDGASLWVQYEGDVRRWSLPSAAAVENFPRQIIPRSTAFFHPEGKLCVVEGERGAEIASMADGKILRKLLEAADVGPAAYQPEKGKLLALVADGKLLVLDSRSGGKVLSEDLGSPCRIAEASPGGAWLVWGSDWQSLELADLKKGCKGTRIAGEAGSSLWSTALDPRGKLIAAIQGFRPSYSSYAYGRRSNLGSLWQIEGKRLKRSSAFDKEADSVGSVAFSPDGQWLAAGSRFVDPPHVKLLSLKAGKFRPPIRLPMGRSGNTNVHAVTFDAKSKLLAAAVDLGRGVTVVDVAEGKTAFELPLPGEYPSPRELAFSPAGPLLAVSTYGEVLLHDVEGRRLKKKLKSEYGSAEHIAFSPDGKLLAWTASSGWGSLQLTRLVLMDVAAGAEVKSIPAHSGGTTGVYFLSDGKMIATAGYDGALRLWGVKKEGEGEAGEKAK